MSATEDFISFWADLTNTQSDAARLLANAYQRTLKELYDLRAGTLELLQPVKNSKGAWVPGFAPDKIDQAAALGTAIEQADEKHKSVSRDIEEFLAASGGKFTITEIANERNQLNAQIEKAGLHAATAMKKAVNRDIHASPAVLMQKAEVSEAYDRLQQVKDETTGPLAALNEQIGKMRKITDRYER